MQEAYMSNKVGYTLIELLVVIIIMGVTAVITMYGFKVLKQHLDVSAEADALTSMIVVAKEEALARHHNVYLCFLGISNRCQEKPSARLGLVSAAGRYIASIILPNTQGQLFWRAYPYYRHHIVFTATGNNDNASFWFCRVGESRPDWVVTLSREGVLQRHEGSAGAQGKYSLSCATL